VTLEKAYAILEVEAGSDPKLIQRAYRRRALQFHPDRVKPEEAEYYARKFMEIRDAYELLRKQGFPIPQAEQVVEEPVYYRRTAGRSFAAKREDPDAERWRNLSTGMETSPWTILLWCVVIPAGAVGVVLFFRFLLRQGTP